MKKKLLFFAAIVSCFISAGLFLRQNIVADVNSGASALDNNNQAEKTVTKVNPPLKLEFNPSQNVNNDYSSEELEIIKNLDNQLTELEHDLADYLVDVNASSQAGKTFRRILKKNNQTAKFWNILNEIDAKQRKDWNMFDAAFYWRMFFDEKDFDAELSRDDFDERAFEYLSLVDPLWVLRNAVYVRHNAMQDFNGKWPNRFAEFPVYRDFIAGRRAESPLLGVAHILKRSYTAGRGEKSVDEMVRALTACGFNVKGKAWTDIGSGSGCVLPFIRDAIGKEASLTVTELDPFTLDLLAYMAKPANAKVLPVTVLDCCLPEASQDIISMVGVHLGDDFPSKYEESTLPWLITINKALRKDGVLVINDGNSDLLDKDIVGKVERAGFKLRKMFLPKEPIDEKDGENCDRIEFIAVFEKANK